MNTLYYYYLYHLLIINAFPLNRETFHIYFLHLNFIILEQHYIYTS